jgi:hypothetical protein
VATDTSKANPKPQIPNKSKDQNPMTKAEVSEVLNLLFWSFEIVWDFFLVTLNS